MFLDIETSPIIGFSWTMRETDIIKKIKPFTILSVAYKWFGEKTRVIAQDNLSEKSLLKKLHSLLSEAEIVIAHNGDSFDIKKINARFIVHRIPPPSPYKTVDTKTQALRIAYFDSNKLNELGIDLDEGEKIKHRGIEMWEGCMAGRLSDWRDMKRYNKKDVDLLERIYLRLRPWIKNHPRVGELGNCKVCGSNKLQHRGIQRGQKRSYKRTQCQNCGNWDQGEAVKNLKIKIYKACKN